MANLGSNRGLILWTLGGAGVFLLYAAYSNQSPTGLLIKHLGGSPDVAPISGGSPASPSSPVSPTDPNYKGTTTDPSHAASPDDPYYATQAPGQDGAVSYRHYAQDGTGTYYALDASGNPTTVIPGFYQKNPALYIGSA